LGEVAKKLHHSFNHTYGLRRPEMVADLAPVINAGLGSTDENRHLICLTNSFEAKGLSVQLQGDVTSSEPSIGVLVSHIQILRGPQQEKESQGERPPKKARLWGTSVLQMITEPF
jgi:hypothetical protein